MLFSWSGRIKQQEEVSSLVIWSLVSQPAFCPKICLSFSQGGISWWFPCCPWLPCWFCSSVQAKDRKGSWIQVNSYLSCVVNSLAVLGGSKVSPWVREAWLWTRVCYIFGLLPPRVMCFKTLAAAMMNINQILPDILLNIAVRDSRNETYCSRGSLVAFSVSANIEQRALTRSFLISVANTQLWKG